MLQLELRGVSLNSLSNLCRPIAALQATSAARLCSLGESRQNIRSSDRAHPRQHLQLPLQRREQELSSARHRAKGGGRGSHRLLSAARWLGSWL